MSTHYIEEAERLCDTVTIMSHGEAVAVGSPRDLVAEHTGGEAVEVYGGPARLREVEAEMRGAWRAHAPHRHLRGDTRRGRPQRRHAGRRAAAGEPRGRLRSADGRGDRVTTLAARGAVNRVRSPDGSSARRSPACSRARSSTSRSYWRSTTFSSTVEPTIYLLAFGFGFGSIVSTVAGYDYVQFVGTGTVATAVLFSSIFPGDVRDVRQVPVPAHLRRDPRGAGRHRGARHRRGAVAGDARGCLRLHAAARRDVLRARPELGDAAVPIINFVAGFAFASASG